MVLLLEVRVAMIIMGIRVVALRLLGLRVKGIIWIKMYGL